MNFGLTKTQALHLLKVAVWVMASTIIGGGLALLQNHPELAGVYTPAINVFLVTVQQLVKKPEDDITVGSGK